jgi:hypothetical protein
MGNLLAVLVVAILAATVWQTWDHWRSLAGFPDARRTRDGRRFGPQGMRFPVYAEPDPDGLDWEMRDRVRTALEIQDDRAWAEIEPKVAAVVRLQRMLRDTADSPAEADEPASLATVRENRSSLRVALKKAQDELRIAVTQRQEAALVLLGLLD